MWIRAIVYPRIRGIKVQCPTLPSLQVMCSQHLSAKSAFTVFCNWLCWKRGIQQWQTQARSQVRQEKREIPFSWLTCIFIHLHPTLYIPVCNRWNRSGLSLQLSYDLWRYRLSLDVIVVCFKIPATFSMFEITELPGCSFLLNSALQCWTYGHFHSRTNWAELDNKVHTNCLSINSVVL